MFSEHYDEHYAKMKLQPIELMQMLVSEEEFIGYLKCSIIKYRLRAGYKEGESAEKDLAKMDRYAEWFKQAKEGKTINPRE